MKLLIENWRLYSGEYDFNILCENHKRGLISEAQLLETWEKQVLTEMDQLLDEGMVDVLKIGYEKGKQLVGKAKETWDAAIEKLEQFYLNLCIQAWGLMQRIKRGLGKVAAVLKKALNTINKFCVAHPILCKVVKLLLMILAVAAVMALFSSEARAAVSTAGLPGGTEGAVLTDEGVSSIKGLLQIVTQDTDPVIQENAVKAVEWLEKAHASETLVDLATSTAEGAERIRTSVQLIKDATQDDPSALTSLVEIGEKVYVQINDFTQDASSLGGQRIHIEWESLAVPK